MKRSARGRITSRIDRQIWLMLISQSVWLALLLGFCIWWGTLLRQQAYHIADLQIMAGVASEVVSANLAKLNRIVYWEAGTIVLLVFIVSIYIVWLFLRDARRTRSVQSFFAGVTHELRTPMTGIRLQAESIAEKTDPSDSRYKLVKRLLEDTGQLESHLEQTLELARVEGGNPPQLQAIDLAQFVQLFLQDWRCTHILDSWQVQHEMGDSLCMADPVALQTIFRNLFDNTLRHSGTTDVRVNLSTNIEGHEITVHYADNGQGFSQDPAMLPRAFFKGTASSGSGVGLYLVNALMQQMGGKVRFESNQGFHAYLQLPLATGPIGNMENSDAG